MEIMIFFFFFKFVDHESVHYNIKRALSSILINVLKCLKNIYFVCYTLSTFL